MSILQTVKLWEAVLLVAVMKWVAKISNVRLSSARLGLIVCLNELDLLKFEVANCYLIALRSCSVAKFDDIWFELLGPVLCKIKYVNKGDKINLEN